MSQTLFGLISINSLTISIALTAPKSPQEDLSINTQYISRQLILAIRQSVNNLYNTIY